MMAALKTDQTWRLSMLLKGLATVPEQADVLVSELSSDSRTIRNGEVFIAYPGLSGDGRDYIDQAVAHGAAAVISHADSNGESIGWYRAAGGNAVPVVSIPELADKVGVIADRFFGSPSKTTTVLGVTGTNGKTSCTHFLAQAFGDRRCAVIGTLGWGFSEALRPSAHTTPGVLDVHRWLSQLQRDGARAVAMEVSSHALDQKRVAAVKFDCAIFTNLSHEHLDYHGDMTSYGMAKRLLFQREDLRYAVINADDPFGRDLMQSIDESVQVFTYGLEKGPVQPDVFASDVGVEKSGIRFSVLTPWGKGKVRVPLLGRFNVSNVLAVLTVSLIYGNSLSEAIDKVATLHAVPGRMQRIASPGRPLVVVDYAHTPDALEHVLSALREHTKGDLWCVFGCGGDRDRSKRAPMGHLAETLADHVVLTNDNPRHEDPQQIIRHIQAGMNAASGAQVIPERADAIRYALDNAAPEDVVLIAGKGHEDYQIIGEQRLSFSDVAVVKQYLEEVSS